MKYAFALVAGLAILASVHAAPAAEGDVYISNSLRQIIAALRGKFQVKIDELKKRSDEIRAQIRTATGEVKAELKKSLDIITNELRSNFQQLLEALRRATRGSEQNYIKNAIVERIRSYREKAREILLRVSEIVKREAAAIGADARNRFEEQKQTLIEQVHKINEQIKDAVREAVSGNRRDIYNDESNNYSLESDNYSLESDKYIIDMSAIRSRIGQLAEKLTDLRRNVKNAAQAKKQEILQQIDEIKVELAEAVKDLRNALRHIFGKEPLTYSMQPANDEVYFIGLVRELRAQLNKKLEELKIYADMVKAAHGLVTENVRLGFETLKQQIAQLKEDIIQKVKDELNKN